MHKTYVESAAHSLIIMCMHEVTKTGNEAKVLQLRVPFLYFLSGGGVCSMSP